MPNWCNTSYTFEGTKDEIAELYQKLQSLDEMTNPLVENEFGKFWLGCVVTLFGGDWKEIYCRGNIDYLEKTTDTTINLSTTTAWGDMPEVWNFVLKQYPSIKFYYSAEESGMCYYATNDVEGKFFPNRFQVEESDGETEYYETIESVLADISIRLGMQISTKEEMCAALKIYNEENENEWISVNEFQVINNKTE